jgi:hypothetical protein
MLHSLTFFIVIMVSAWVLQLITTHNYAKQDKRLKTVELTIFKQLTYVTMLLVTYAVSVAVASKEGVSLFEQWLNVLQAPENNIIIY